MRAELVAIGSELLLGQSIDTNSVWISQRLAEHGIDCYRQTSIGDNLDRLTDVLKQACERSEIVICTGGLGPTQDDITREAIATVMNVELVEAVELVEVITEKFASRNRPMAANNLLQAEVPVGAEAMSVMPGTAPGLICPVSDDSFIYAMPGVPYEMKEMFDECVLPHIASRKSVSEVIQSRLLRTWGMSESGLAELLDPVIVRLDNEPEDSQSSATLAFLASGVEGLKVRVTVKAATQELVTNRLDAEEQLLRELIEGIVFGTDQDTMESVVIDLLRDQGLTLSVAESLTGGYISGRICGVPGASQVFRGGVVAYSPQVKADLLKVTSVEQVSEEAALQMAKGVRFACGSDVGLATTGVAGPDELEGKPVGTVCVAIDSDRFSFSETFNLPKTREQVRQLSTITALNELRKQLL